MLKNDKKKDVIVYCNVSNGQIVIKADKSNPGAVARTDKNGNTVYELHFDRIAGELLAVRHRIRPEPFANEWIVELRDRNTLERYFLSLFENSRTADALLKRLLGGQYVGKEIEIKPIDFIDKQTGKRVLSCNLFCDGIKVAAYITRENTQGCPDIVAVPVNGKTQWDCLARNKWFMERLVALGYWNNKPQQQRTPAPSEQSAQTLARQRHRNEDDNMPF
jgi:hypothetical protein